MSVIALAWSYFNCLHLFKDNMKKDKKINKSDHLLMKNKMPNV